MLEKNEILIVILALLITFYLVIAMGAKQKTKSNQSTKIYILLILLSNCFTSNEY